MKPAPSPLFLGLPAPLLLALVLLVPAPAAAKVIDTFGAWTAFVEGSKSKRVCYMAGAPKKEEGKYESRGATLAMITHRKAEKSRNVVSIRAGYTYKKDSQVTATIGDKTFTLYTDGGDAWAENKIDHALVKAMRAGAKMVVKGTSSRGTLTTDTYSLKGFTAAHKAINKACGIK